MLCQVCGKREAVYEFIEVVEGKVYKKFVCEYCISIAEVGFVKPDYSKVSVSEPEVKKCPVCGTTFEDFVASGQVGCVECYKTFKTIIPKLLRTFHGDVQYKGRLRSISEKKRKMWRQLKRLKEELQNVLKKEDYSKAAKLRDKIKQLEEELWKEER